jgi:hypothetical protein
MKAWLFLAMVLLAGCPREERIWLESGASRDRLVVLRGEQNGQPEGRWLRGFVVQTCAGGVFGGTAENLWEVWINDSAPPRAYPSRIVYGEVPQGYASPAAAKPIAGSCVRVVAGGPSVIVRFDSTGVARIDQGS